MKKIVVRIAADPDLHEVFVTEEETAADVIAGLGLSDNYCLTMAAGRAPLRPDARIFNNVNDGQTLFSTFPPDVA